MKEYLENLQFLVFDEADRLLTNESFKDDLEYIMDNLVPQADTRDAMGNGRQTFLFSATMSDDYDRLISKQILFGEKFNESQIINCGQTGNTDETFIKTVHGLK